MGRYLLVMGMLGCVATVRGDDILNTVRSEVRTPSESETKSSDNRSEPYSSSCSNYDDGLDGEFSLFCAKLFGYIFASPFYGPPMSIGDHYEVSFGFVSYPYARDWPGLMQPAPRAEDDPPGDWARPFNFRASIEDGNNFDGLNRVGFNFLADSYTRFGVGGGVHFYQEKQACGCTDELAIGDVNLLFRFAQSERIQFRTGLGARFLTDRVRTDWGFNFVYGAEAYPFKPVSWSWQLETGTLGEAWVFRANTRLGYVWRYSEAYVGYDYLRIGHAELQGPMVGMRVWF
jgi:hypothetical protein